MFNSNNFKSIYDRRMMFVVLERQINLLLHSCNCMAIVATKKFTEGTI